MDTLEDIWEWFPSSWLAGDLPSWAAVLIAVGAFVLAWRAIQARSYIEALPGWKIHIDDESGDVEVSAGVKLATHAAYVGGDGEISFGRRKSKTIKLSFDRREHGRRGSDEMTLYFKGHTALKMTQPKKGKLKL